MISFSSEFVSQKYNTIWIMCKLWTCFVLLLKCEILSWKLRGGFYNLESKGGHNHWLLQFHSCWKSHLAHFHSYCWAAGSSQRREYIPHALVVFSKAASLPRPGPTTRPWSLGSHFSISSNALGLSLNWETHRDTKDMECPSIAKMVHLFL